MNISAAKLEWLLSPSACDTSGANRTVLAGLLLELAKNVDASVDAQSTGVTPFDPRLEQLRTLLLGREIEVSERFSRLLEDPEQLANAISHVLPTAIAQASIRDERLGMILAPALEKATQSSVRKNPRALVEILYPLIVPAIGKSISEKIDATFQSFNESLKHSLTWSGLKWRWEAWRTGTSFAEVVLKHSLVYQVEHVFLIHGHTGLLIAHAASPDAASQDPQLVSSMLSAIQDFVRDSFSGGEQGLDALRLGELRLWSERGPFATLVAVIRGNPPEELHEKFRSVLLLIHAERHEALEKFDGDSSGLADVEAALAQCVQLRQEAQRSKQTGFGWLFALIAIVLVGLAAKWGYQWWHDERRWGDYLERLRAQPGIVITEVGKRDGQWLVRGLRDPLAIAPSLLLQDLSIDPGRIVAHWEPYQSLSPQFALKRLQDALELPPTVTLALEGDRIVARGSAVSTWIQRARASGRMLPAGSPQLDVSQVEDIHVGALGKLRDSVQSKVILFDNNSPLPAPGQDAVLDQLASELNELTVLSSSLHAATRVVLTGHSDAAGQGTFNLSLSMARAEAVRALLKKRGVDPDLLAVRGAGPLEPRDSGETPAARSMNRRVSFTVGVNE